MAIEVEKLLVTLEARVDQYEKNLAKASGTTDTQMGAIESRGKRMEAALLASTGRGARGFDALNKSVKGSEVQVGNLAAQFNDIGVQLAGGQSPFLIALQQGSQITQAFGGSGIRGALMGVGGALASLVSPISLVTIGLITAGGFAVQYFADLISGGEKAEMTLQEQQSLLERVAKRWGEAVPGLKAYVDELQRAKDVGDLQTAGGIKIAEDQASINAALDEFISKNEDVVTALNLAYDATGRSDTSLSKFAATWETLVPKVRDGTATQEDFATATSALRAAVADSGGDLDAFGTQFETIAGRITNALAALQQFQQRMRDALNTGIRTQAEIQNLTTGRINNPNLPDPNFQLPGEGPVPGVKPSLLDYDPNATGGRSSSSKSDPYADATRSLNERTAALEAQRQAQAGLNPLVNDYGYAVEFAKARQDLLTAAQKGGKEITPQLAAEIDRLAGAYASTSAEIQKMAESSKNAAAALQFQKDLLNGVLSDMRSALEDGKLTWKDLANVAVNALNKIADRLQSMLVDQLFAKGFGGLFGNMFGGAAPLVPGVGGGAPAPGAPIAAANAKAPTLSPSQAARSAKVPSGAARKVEPLEVRVAVDDEGALRAYVQKEGARTEARVALGAKAALKSYRKNDLHNDINSHLRNPRRRGNI